MVAGSNAAATPSATNAEPSASLRLRLRLRLRQTREPRRQRSLHVDESQRAALRLRPEPAGDDQQLLDVERVGIGQLGLAVEHDAAVGDGHARGVAVDDECDAPELFDRALAIERPCEHVHPVACERGFFVAFVVAHGVHAPGERLEQRRGVVADRVAHEIDQGRVVALRREARARARRRAQLGRDARRARRDRRGLRDAP